MCKALSIRDLSACWDSAWEQLCVCVCVCVCLNTIVVLHSLHLQLRDTGAKMMDLLINIFIHFKI